MKTPKAGADDFVASGHAETDLAALPGPAAIGEPTCARAGDDLLFVWPECDVRIEVTAIKEHSEGVTAELAVRLASRELHWGRLQLASTPARGQFVKRLAQQHRALPWGTLVEHACRQTVTEIRRPEEPTVLLRARPIEGSRYLIEPFVPLDETALIFADGGSGKGYLALSCCAAVQAGIALPGGFGASRRVPILYADWETNRPTIEDRLHRLGRGLGVSLDGLLHYRRLFRPLAAELRTLRADISRFAIGFFILDSLGPACSTEAEGSGAAIEALGALRSFSGVSRLVLAHISKSMADQRGATRPYGSVFVQNLARSAWEARAAREDNRLTVALYDRKENDAPLRQEPIPFCFTFESSRVLLSTGSLADEPALLHPASLTTQVLIALADGMPRKGGQLADMLEASEATIMRTLRRLAKADKVVRSEGENTGRGNEILWRKRT